MRGKSRLGTSSCPIDLKFLPVITINLRNSDNEWADMNQQSAFLQTGLMYTQWFKSLICEMFTNQKVHTENHALEPQIS